MTEKEKQEIIEFVHKTLHDFCEPFPEGELGARPLTKTEKTLLEVNKVLCEKIQEMPTVERLLGEWRFNEDGNYECSRCGIAWKDMPVKDAKPVFKACPWCGVEMRDGEVNE